MQGHLGCSVGQPAPGSRVDTDAEEVPLTSPLLQSTERPHSACASQPQVQRTCIQASHTPPTPACAQITPTGLVVVCFTVLGGTARAHRTDLHPGRHTLPSPLPHLLRAPAQVALCWAVTTQLASLNTLGLAACNLPSRLRMT